MIITVVQQGRLRDPAVEGMRDEYVKRFGRFGKLHLVEREPKGAGTLWPEAARWRVVCDERGDRLVSTAFAEKLRAWTMAHGHVAFLVGAAEGLHQPSRDAAQAAIRLSDFTLPHQLAHLLLVEQLYRAATLLAGHPYHKP
jgi:23S rRNA (pseudouridine1915-N3)-methyltransferase